MSRFKDHDNIIVFPKFYDELWARGKGNDILGAQSLLIDHITPRRSRLVLSTRHIVRPFADSPELHKISKSLDYQSVLQLLKDVKDRVFGGKHQSFKPGSLLQKMRFVFIKSRLLDRNIGICKEIHSFFFDPTIQRQGKINCNFEKVQKLGSIYPFPIAPLVLLICGGGPVGLMTAINLYERCKNSSPSLEIHIYDKRWEKRDGRVIFTSKRRHQIVTIQDGVCQRLSRQTEAIMFGSFQERVWPHSRNISIMKIEDHLLEAVQSEEMRSVIHLHTEEVVSPEDLSIPYHILISAEGTQSKIQQRFFSQDHAVKSKGFALGVAFNYPQEPKYHPNTQAFNVFLTMAQSRYLLNSSLLEGRGLLNIQLTQHEWDQATLYSGEKCTFKRPGKLSLSTPVNDLNPPNPITADSFNPFILRNDLWKSIQDGLHLFGIDESDVTEILGIPINVCACTTGLKVIPSTSRPHALAFLVGDAALTVHFWPGRGLNSGVKMAIACADVIASAIQRKSEIIDLTPHYFNKYTEYLKRLEAREHDGRSMFVVNQSGDPDILLRRLNLEPALVPDAESKFVEEVCKVAQRMEARRDWTHARVMDVEIIIRSLLKRVSIMSVQDMVASGPWPVEKMTGPEVYPILDHQPLDRLAPVVCCLRGQNENTSSLVKDRNNETLADGLLQDMESDHLHGEDKNIKVTCTC